MLTLVGTSNCDRYKLKLITIMSVTAVLYMVIYNDFMVRVLVLFGYRQIYTLLFCIAIYLVMAERG